MIFASKDYKELFLKDFGSFQDWQEALNVDWRYCQTIKDIDEYTPYCESWQLPSWHPYWKREVLKDIPLLIEAAKAQINSARSYIESTNGTGKYVSNAESNIVNLEFKIKEYKEKLKTY
jgi:hypothetical protein